MFSTAAQLGSTRSAETRQAPGCLVVFSDVVCPWATVIVLRLLRARAQAGADRRLAILHRAMPLELQHERPIPRRVVDAEIPLCASLTPDFGWSVWQGRADEYPVTVLPALEAVAAAGHQSAEAGEQLDLALRRAFFTRSRCISMRHEILAVARTCDAVDVGQVADALDRGAFRGALTDDFAEARAAGVPCSGTVVLHDGTMICNPGTRVGWVGGKLPHGTPVLNGDEPEIYDKIIADALVAQSLTA
jgi:predicted DsbA family dithiol-disulfide isomerase